MGVQMRCIVALNTLEQFSFVRIIFRNITNFVNKDCLKAVGYFSFYIEFNFTLSSLF